MASNFFAAAIVFPWALHALITLTSVVEFEMLTTTGALCIIGAAFGAASRAWWSAGAVVPSEQTPWSKLTRALVAVAVIAHLLIIVQSALLPTTAYDALGYRLPAIAQWLDAKRIIWVSSDDELRNGYPLGNEAITAVFAALRESFAHSDLTAYLFLLPGLGGVFAITRAWGGTRDQAALATAIFALVPMTLLNIGSGYVDAAFAGALTAALGAGVMWLQSRDSVRDAFLFGAALALVACTKANGSVFALALAAIALALRIREKRWPLASEVIVCILAMAPGFFWLVRNIKETGDPLWPVDLAIAGHVIAKGMGPLEQVLDVAHNVPPLLTHVPSPLRPLVVWLELHGPARSFDDRFAGLGLAWLATLVAIVWNTRRNWRQIPRNPLFLLVFLTVSLWFLAQPERWWARYTIWLWALGAPCLALMMPALRAAKRGTWIVAAIGCVICFEAVVAVTYAHDLPRLIARDQLHVFHPGTSTRDRFIALAHLSPQWRDYRIEDEPARVCRTQWRAGSDNANLDGYFAQLSPRRSVHVIMEGTRSFDEVIAEARGAHCANIIALRGSPLASQARGRESLEVVDANAFDPFTLIRLH